MKKLLILLDNKATAKLEDFAEYIIARFKLEEKDRPSVYKIEQKFKSTYPKNRPSQQEWFKEYRVSMLYGRETTVHIGG
jgi:hypothetical protein